MKVLSRQSDFQDDFRAEFTEVKCKHGSGPTVRFPQGNLPRSWAEGMTRRAARRIARKRVHEERSSQATV